MRPTVAWEVWRRFSDQTRSRTHRQREDGALTLCGVVIPELGEARMGCGSRVAIVHREEVPDHFDPCTVCVALDPEEVPA